LDRVGSVVDLLLVCGCHFSFAAVMTCTCLPSFITYPLLAQIDNNDDDINIHSGYVHHMNQAPQQSSFIKPIRLDENQYFVDHC
jgi:hypothetical protein